MCHSEKTACDKTISALEAAADWREEDKDAAGQNGKNGGRVRIGKQISTRDPEQVQTNDSGKVGDKVEED